MRKIQTVLENLRYKCFWMLDRFLRDGKIKKHLGDITYILENFSSPEAKKNLSLKLERLTQHVRTTTDFYKNHMTFEGFPVINKNMVRDRYQEFRSKRYTKKKLKTVSTSGSTSITLKINQNKSKIIRNTADTIYFSRLAGFRIGYKLLYLRHWDNHLRKSSFRNFSQNIKELEVLNMNDVYISKIISEITEDPSNKGWLGYPSGYELICKYLDKTNSKPLKVNTKSIIAMSEGVNRYTKESMKKYFNVPLVSRYSNMENGIVAQQKIGEDTFAINWASYHVEIFKLNEDILAEPGEPGRIVVTDLYNYANPLIRYDTGDVGTIDYTATPPVLKNIEGRKTDVIYNTKGEIVSSFIVTNVVEYKGVIQGQLIQKSNKKYELKLNTTNEFNQKQQVIEEFKGYLGSDAIINIKYVKGIPLLSSGKRKATVNNFVKNY
ncbi:CoF synthetase [Flavivirga aquimarina]|uniref:CoF synthetase n=1 Tax=Flavivirga aquimarina TaxID=2027862 RepID=A0ABT8WDB4_9FLAO|nr:CoF synthetase [Flavivirga aquimarina]MDO5971144.1 CoF synthetase [Flavivirga aquimarina]